MQSLYHRENIEFSGEGVSLRGWLYRPEAASQPVPGIVMAHGYNCIKELYLDKFAECFAQMGFAVLAFDNRNFGDSDGEPRQELDPWQQVRDYRHAITFMQTQSFVDPTRIGIWGTSYSGGHVLVVAALDRRVKCVVSQVPTISGWQNMLRRVQPADWITLRVQFDQDRQNRFNGLSPKLVPMITNPDDKGAASHASRDAWDFFTGHLSSPEDQWRFAKWRNEVTLRSIEMYSEYEPGSYIERVAPTPLLMIVADNDVVAVTDLALDAFNRAHGIKKLHMFRGGHFSAYTDLFRELSHEAGQWFKSHLCS